MNTLLGVLVVGLGGLIMGSGAWPFKLMKRFQFEHWWFIGMLVGLIVMPWTITLLGCRNVLEGLKAVPPGDLLLANLFAFGWGIANVLCGLCFVRIGVALTGAILAGLGISVGAVMPLVIKGSGLFQDAPDISSPAGLMVLAGIAVMLVGVVFASIAGFGRERELKKAQETSGGFLGGLIMTVVAGILSTGTAFTFIYSHDHIVSNLSWVHPGSKIDVTVEGHPEMSGDHEVLPDGTIALNDLEPIPVGGRNARQAAEEIAAAIGKKRSDPLPEVKVDTGSIAANFGFWAVGLFAGALVNIFYAAYLLTKNRSWGALARSGKELLLAIAIGINFSVAVTLMGKGMLLLGALGGSVGWGIQQAMQMTGNQALGFLSGEWRGVAGTARRRMFIAIAIFFLASAIMTYGKILTAG